MWDPSVLTAGLSREALQGSPDHTDGQEVAVCSEKVKGQSETTHQGAGAQSLLHETLTDSDANPTKGRSRPAVCGELNLTPQHSSPTGQMC